MTIEQNLDSNLNNDTESCNQSSDDWLHDSVSFLESSFMDDPYDASTYQWWDQSDDNLIFVPEAKETVASDGDHSKDEHSRKATINTTVVQSSQLSKKRKATQETDDNTETVTKMRRSSSSSSNRKSSAKGNSCGNGNNKEGRWAEQLLNQCASAIMTGNLTRIQHLLYVLHELASPSGDANHRLASHGLRALRQLVSSSLVSSSPGYCFAATDARLFQQALLKFNEVSPWFSFPNAIANASIIQVLATQPSAKTVHILDIGVSHGLQWPTLFEALSRRCSGGGPPPLLRLTIVNETIQNSSLPFSTGPSGDDYPKILLRSAKSYNLNFEINVLRDQPLQTLTRELINVLDNETLIVCTQFRLHHLNHASPNDERTIFMQTLTDLNPDALILTDNDMQCTCLQCGDFAQSFIKRFDYLWKFLDSTSAAFKGRECEQRRIIEGEAALALTSKVEMNETKERWCEQFRSAGFNEVGFSEDVIDGGRALLRKYDSNWEMKVGGDGGIENGVVRLWWKGQPVSFCSLWNLNKKRSITS